MALTDDLAEFPTDDPYLSGPLAPVTDEVDLETLPVTGEIPDALHGVFVRNGPNPEHPPRGAYHFFDGDGMVHGVWLEGGQARRYRNRWVETEWLDVERRFGRACFGGMSDFGPVERAARDEVGPVKNPANTHVIRHAGRILCLWEIGQPHELTPDLDTVGAYDFDGALTTGMTAHPHEDPETGDLLFFGYGPFPPFLTYYRADVEGRIVEKAEIDVPDSVMMHDFVVTRDHIGFLDAPAIFNFEQALAGGAAYDWKPDRGTRFGLFRRDEGPESIRWYEVEPGYVFHFLNAYDEGTKVVIDGCRQPRLNMGQTAEEAGTPDLGRLTRWTIDTASGAVNQELLDDTRADLPRIDERRTGLRNEVGYLTGWSAQPSLAPGTFDMVYRIDLATGTRNEYRHPPGRTASESVFAPDPSRTGEDDGWLLSFVHDANTQTSDLVILDAADPSAGPVATVHLPVRVPFGFHGSWLPDQG